MPTPPPTTAKRISLHALQVLMVLFGIYVFAWMLAEPQLEGRNAGATLSEIYFNDPFLTYAYTLSLAFFAGVYQAYRIFGSAARGELISLATAKALRTLRWYALVLIAGIAVPVSSLLVVRPGDDIAGGVMMGAFLIFVFVSVAAAAAVSERSVRTGLNK